MLKINTKVGPICIAKVNINETLVDKLLNICDENCQIIRAECYEEVVFATILAIKAVKEGRNIAKTIKGEILVRLAGVKQIKDALKIVGASGGENFVVVFGVDDPCEKLRQILSIPGVTELELTKCPEGKIKKAFERIAMVEAL
ncbi:hypothetical protein PNA2_1411 [Pyrococcus sp. NA2]|uniref:KEOPS complex subunit Cgi121 n=1 Tax=Pyrococcus sp. (strain NA2) TaxID=342949 RepID=UPI000209AF14|nr:KEOPS complex subunit Cgi121 [Pyrococcus sp. NA2]AEC52326.1 hypothetical protein PNA2_1411 [Pyrococcus sp. NA2]